MDNRIAHTRSGYNTRRFWRAAALLIAAALCLTACAPTQPDATAATTSVAAATSATTAATASATADTATTTSAAATAATATTSMGASTLVDDATTAAPSASTSASADASGQAANVPAKLIVGIAQDFDTIDPVKAVAAGSQEVLYNIAHGLINITPGGEIIAELASSYEVSDDLLTYTFKVREGVKFHNGDPLTADDIVYTFLRCAGRTADEPAPINADVAALVADVTAPDQSTVVFTLNEPSSAFISQCILPVIPKDSGPAQAEHPIGTGPYAFKSYSPGIGIELTRFEDYYGQKPVFPEAEFRIFTNANAGHLALQNGEIHIMNLAATTLDYDETKLKLVKQPQNMVQLLAFNQSFEPFTDIRVRRALNYAVDKHMIIDMLSPGSPAIDTNLSPVMPYYYNTEIENYYPYDPEQALALLDEAGYGGGGLRFTVRVPAEYQFHIDTAQIIQQQYEAVGVTMDIETIEWNSWLSEVYEQREHESTIIGLTGKADPGEILGRQATDYYRNFCSYSNEAFDALLDEADAIADIAERARLYKEAQRVLAEDAAHVFLMDPGNNVLMDKNIGGYTTYPMPYIDLRLLTYGQVSD